jgi:hypothetical protein
MASSYAVETKTSCRQTINTVLRQGGPKSFASILVAPSLNVCPVVQVASLDGEAFTQLQVSILFIELNPALPTLATNASHHRDDQLVLLLA